MRAWTDADADEAELGHELLAPLTMLRSRGDGCPDPALWPALAAGVVPADVSSAATVHLGRCPTCRAVAHDILSDDVLSAAEANPVAPPLRRAWPEAPAPRTRDLATGPGRPRWTAVWRLVSAAAAVAVALASSSYLWMTAGRPASPVAPVSPPFRQAAPTPPPSWALPLEKPPVAIPLVSALVWRSQAGGGTDRYLEELAEALTPYRADDFVEATLRLESLARRHPASETWFYLGVSRLMTGQADAGVADLRRALALSQPPLQHDARWYLAVALERAGAIEASAAELRVLCAGGGERRARACDALPRLQTAGR